MRRSFTNVLLLIGVLFFAQPAAAQSAAPPPEDAMQAARELVTTMNMTAQFRAILPSLMQALRPAIVQNRPEVARDFDVVLPMVMETMLGRINELNDIWAIIYARNFTVAELRDIRAFYRTETGQKLLAKMPAITQEGLVAGQKFGQSLAADFQQRIVDELRKKGHNI
jgi:hypothetical protein